MARNGNKVFVSITNRQIYDELSQFKAQNAKEHLAILEEIAGYKSQVLNLRLALGGIGILAMSTLGWLVLHISA